MPREEIRCSLRMTFVYLLMLQLAVYNVQGRHFIVETEEGNDLESSDQVYQNFLYTRPGPARPRRDRRNVYTSGRVHA